MVAAERAALFVASSPSGKVSSPMVKLPFGLWTAAIMLTVGGWCAGSMHRRVRTDGARTGMLWLRPCSGDSRALGARRPEDVHGCGVWKSDLVFDHVMCLTSELSCWEWVYVCGNASANPGPLGRNVGASTFQSSAYIASRKS